MRIESATLICVVFGLSACSDPDAPKPLVATKAPFAAPVDGLAGAMVQSCGVYEATRCEAGRQQTCTAYDSNAKAFRSPDALTHRAWLWERYHDLYHTPDGQDAKRYLRHTFTATASEAEWAAPDNFGGYNGLGDSAIWSGTALNAKVMRYLVTGTEADYAAMTEQVRTMLSLFDVTGIPGYLARYHFYRMPVGGPQTDEHAIFFDDEPLRHTDHLIEDAGNIEGLPALYTEGLADSAGQLFEGTAMWHGTPTIDQYSGLTASLPAAWSLLKDEALKKRISDHMSCYLKRLKRIELINLAAQPELSGVLKEYLNGGAANFDPEDVDLSRISSLVMYVTEQPNSLNADTFDRSCPDSIALTPSRVLDGRSGSFQSELLSLLADMRGKKEEHPTGLDHYYVPNARGPDAVHLMNLAAAVYHMTGDEMYLRFLEDELIGNIGTIDIAQTFASVIPPKWCRKWYASHIAFVPLWGINNLLDDSILRDQMQRVLHEEAWKKDAALLGNAKFSLMYAGALSSETDGEQAEALAQGAVWLKQLQGNGGVPDAPRRSYLINVQTVSDGLPADVEPECPTPEIRKLCEDGVEIFGTKIQPWDITQPCTGALNECMMDNGECAKAMASKALPVGLRGWWGFQWQGDPYSLGSQSSGGGTKQSSGLDLFESYWLARYYGALPEAEGLLLAWQDDGACP